MPENSQPSARKRGTGRPFGKGQSGNPGGRPKLEGEIRALAQKHGPAALARLVELMKSSNERVAVAAAQVILDRGYGKAPQAVNITGNGPVEPVRILFVKAGDGSSIP